MTKSSAEILGLPVISITEGRELGISKTLVVDARRGAVAAITIEDEDWYRGVKLLPYTSVIAIGKDAVTVTSSESILTLEEASDFEAMLDANVRIIGTKAITKTGTINGKVKEVFIDGEGVVEKILIDCLEAEDTEYVRTVTKKTFAAAVARIMRPGIKFDSVLVLDGVQGIGKSSLFKDLIGDEYYCETLTLKDMNEKAGAEKLQGYWIVEIAELAGMKKADIESVKAFLTATDDKYRPSYGRTVESHPRQCIIIASVNGERGYLRDITGNRRYWVVKVKQTEQRKRWNFSQSDKDQIWTEAKALYEQGEKLYLEGDMIAQAEGAQMSAMEEDERKGLVEEYLNTLLPSDWEKKDLYERRNWLSEKGGPTVPDGINKRTEVSNVEIWAECFGRNISDLKPSDSYTIAALMTQIPGWERTTRSRKLPIYGKQRLYVRNDGTEEQASGKTK